MPRLPQLIGDPHVRNRGTIGGSVANNDPAADYPAALLALGATIVTNKREIAADDFFKGLFATALDDGEIITRISFPVPAKFAYAKFANPASRYALVGVAVAQTGKEARVAVTGAGNDGVFRAPAMEAALAKSWSAQSLAGITAQAVRHDERHPRRRGLSRPSGRRAGQAGRRQGWLEELSSRNPSSGPWTHAAIAGSRRAQFRDDSTEDDRWP